MSSRHPPAARPSDVHSNFSALSERERSVVRLVACGYTRAQIARILRTNLTTVQLCKTRITEKLGVTHRADYLRIALDLGLIGKANQGTVASGAYR